MVSEDHIKYLKDALEPDGDAYSYHKLYEWDDQFLKSAPLKLATIEDCCLFLAWEL